MQSKDNTIKTIELLAPAKNLACGIAAIDHGADAVYIGASKFGARQSAGNSVEDIATLCEYAHRFGTKVHVTMNTIIYDNEMDDMLQLVRELEKAKVDALLIQDMGLLKACKEYLKTNLSLHASTQCDSRTAEKVRWLASLGFERVVLARELSVQEIANIHTAVPEVELEAFVHGALCVSYSGICYASQYCFERSANRGACAQFCRMAFDLKDSDGKMIEHQRYLLSLKDMSQIDNLETLMRSGACAFKIEGRLKDINYVKNVVSAYNHKLNAIIAKHPNEFRRASLGRVECNFTPDLNKTFNRGYTPYFADGRQQGIFSPNTPKALGEYVGKVKEIRRDSFNVSSTASFANGDGLCFINKQINREGRTIEALEGFRVNKAVGNRLYPYKMPQGLKAGMGLYRNQDQAFEKELAGQSAVRLLPIEMEFGLTSDGYFLAICLSGVGVPKVETKATIQFEHQEAKKPQRENIVRQLTKLGNTIYICKHVDVADNADQFFIPSSVLAELRRSAIESFALQPLLVEETKLQQVYDLKIKKASAFEYINPSQYKRFPYLYNVSNRAAQAFYEQQGVNVKTAFECMDTNPTHDNPLIMQCRHCIRYSLGYCVVHGGKKPTWKEPLYLELGDKKRFRLEFDCKDCQMNIYAE
ncbi:peptidase U32 family protein [Prevotella aurantiaca]|uniref:peptidase U32 family protein n=1 Tax=Prevotella aurantiaca TaxID=596085 RepID=UPI001CB1EA45|nr:U32 family peptidase [Prevotella aurantiaca]MBF1385688.1 U32 family peptidase [Prevotella aurantiaca]